MTLLTRAVLGLQAGLMERYLIQLYSWSLQDCDAFSFSAS